MSTPRPSTSSTSSTLTQLSPIAPGSPGSKEHIAVLNHQYTLKSSLRSRWNKFLCAFLQQYDNEMVQLLDKLAETVVTNETLEAIEKSVGTILQNKQSTMKETTFSNKESDLLTETHDLTIKILLNNIKELKKSSSALAGTPEKLIQYYEGSQERKNESMLPYRSLGEEQVEKKSYSFRKRNMKEDFFRGWDVMIWLPEYTELPMFLMTIIVEYYNDPYDDDDQFEIRPVYDLKKSPLLFKSPIDLKKPNKAILNEMRKKIDTLAKSYMDASGFIIDYTILQQAETAVKDLLEEKKEMTLDLHTRALPTRLKFSKLITPFAYLQLVFTTKSFFAVKAPHSNDSPVMNFIEAFELAVTSYKDPAPEIFAMAQYVYAVMQDFLAPKRYLFHLTTGQEGVVASLSQHLTRLGQSHQITHLSNWGNQPPAKFNKTTELLNRKIYNVELNEEDGYFAEMNSVDSQAIYNLHNNKPLLNICSTGMTFYATKAPSPDHYRELRNLMNIIAGTNLDDLNEKENLISTIQGLQKLPGCDDPRFKNFLETLLSQLPTGSTQGLGPKGP